MQAVFSLNLCPCANVALFQECCVQQTEQTEVRSFLNLKLPSSTLSLVDCVCLAHGVLLNLLRRLVLLFNVNKYELGRHCQFIELFSWCKREEVE